MQSLVRVISCKDNQLTEGRNDLFIYVRYVSPLTVEENFVSFHNCHYAARKYGPCSPLETEQVFVLHKVFICIFVLLQ